MYEAPTIGHVPLRTAQDFRDGTYLVSQRSRVNAEGLPQKSSGNPHDKIVNRRRPVPKLNDKRKEDLAHHLRPLPCSNKEDVVLASSGRTKKDRDLRITRSRSCDLRRFIASDAARALPRLRYVITLPGGPKPTLPAPRSAATGFPSS